jgi:hypothetical protein
MDIDIDSDEDQVDTWSDGIPKTTTDDHKESLHFFPNNQQVTVRLIKNRNMPPEGALKDDVLDTINTAPIVPSNDFYSILTSFSVVHECKIIVRSSQNSLPTKRNSFVFERIETKLASVASRINETALSVYS